LSKMRRFQFERFKSPVCVVICAMPTRLSKLKKAREKAKDLKAELIVYDLATFKGRLTARLRGVKSPCWKTIE